MHKMPRQGCLQLVRTAAYLPFRSNMHDIPGLFVQCHEWGQQGR